MRSGDGAGRRFLIATAVAYYANAPQWDRPGLVDARNRIIDLFTGVLGYRHVSDLGLNPTRNELTARLRTFCRSPDRRPDDMIAVYIAGHGEVLDDSQEHVLLTSDTDPGDVADALPTAELARKMLLDTPVRRVLLMLDTCYSGLGGNELVAASLSRMTRHWSHDTGSGLVVITSTQPAEQARTGAFPRLLHEAIDGLPTAGHTPAVLPLDSVVKAMNDNPAKPGYQTISSALAQLTGEVPPFLPNPRHDPRLTEVDLAIQQAKEWETQAGRREVEHRTRLLVRAMASHGAAHEWWFCGRQTALIDITSWLNRPDPARPLLAVTAAPGSGKTAVLGLIATLTNPDRRVTVPLHGLGLSSAAAPAAGAVDVVIYAQNLTTEQVMQGIAASARVRADKVGELLEQLSGRATPLTVLVDALDEAADPDELTRHLLRPLADHANGRLRLLVGTRPHLLTNLGLRREDSVDLDAPRYADLDALTTYAARGLLDAVPNSPYQGQPPPTIRAVARAVAEAAVPSFLVARITSGTLAADTTVPDPHDPTWRRTLPRLPGEAMHRDLETRLGDQADRVRDLLRPLAYAEGQGLPWEDIWAPLASRIAEATYTDEDLLWLRRRAGSYVVEATEAGRSAYRLYHHALAEHLRDGADHNAVHRVFTDVLRSRVPLNPDGSRDWTRAHPYTLRHLATHAARCGLLDDLITDLDYLVYAEPDELLIALHCISSDDGRLTRSIYRASAEAHRHLTPQRRRQVLATDALRFAATHQYHALAHTLQWQPRWATGQLTSSALRTILPGSELVTDMVCTTIDGQPVAVAANRSNRVHSVQVWDLTTDSTRAVLAGHQGPVWSVACATVDGRPVAVTAGEDHTVRVWDLTTGAARATLIGHESAVSRVACTSVDDEPVAVTAGRDGTVRVWDLTTGAARATLHGHQSAVYAVACTSVGGRPLAVTASYDNRVVQVWDLTTGTPRATLTGHEAAVTHIACTTVHERPVAITTSQDATARVWDLTTATAQATLTGHEDRTVSAACTTVDGQPVAVTVDDSPNVRIWDLTTGNTRAVLTGHNHRASEVACTTIDGRPVAVTAGHDGPVWVWDLTTETLLDILTGHEGPVRKVVCTAIDGRPVAVTAGDDFTVRVWNLVDVIGRQTTAAGHHGEITAAACTTVHGQPVAVTASDDETVRVWDLATGTTLATLGSQGRWLNAVACTTIDDQPVAVTAGEAGEAQVWDLATGARQLTFTGHEDDVVHAVACTTVHGQPAAVTAGEDETAQVWDLATGTRQLTFTGHKGPVRAVACTIVGGQPLAVTAGDDKTAQVWNLTTGTRQLTFTGHEGPVRAVACMTIDGQPVAITGSEDQTARAWDLTTGTTHAIMTGHRSWVNAVACTTIDGRPVVVTASNDGTVRVWDLITTSTLAVFDFAGYMAGALCVGPAQEIIIGTGWDLVVIDRRPSEQT